MYYILYPQTELSNRPQQPKKVKGESKTVPDQSLTVRELLTRYAHGQELQGQKTPFYEDEDAPHMGIDLRMLDLTEIQELMESYEEKFKTSRAAYKQRKAEEAEAAKQAAKSQEPSE